MGRCIMGWRGGMWMGTGAWICSWGTFRTGVGMRSMGWRGRSRTGCFGSWRGGGSWGWISRRFGGRGGRAGRGCGGGGGRGLVPGELFGRGWEWEVWAGGGDPEGGVSAAGGGEVRGDGSAGGSAAGADERGGVGGSG